MRFFSRCQFDDPSTNCTDLIVLCCERLNSISLFWNKVSLLFEFWIHFHSLNCNFSYESSIRTTLLGIWWEFYIYPNAGICDSPKPFSAPKQWNRLSLFKQVFQTELLTKRPARPSRRSRMTIPTRLYLCTLSWGGRPYNACMLELVNSCCHLRHIHCNASKPSLKTSMPCCHATCWLLISESVFPPQIFCVRI